MLDRLDFAQARALVLAGLALAGSLLLGSAGLAQSDSSAAERQAQISAILDRHSDLTDEARAMGSQVYSEHCAACHDNGVNRAPPASALGSISPGAILRVLTEGPMQEQAAGLEPEQRVAVAEFLTGRMLDSTAVAKPLMCQANDGWFDLGRPPSFAGWGLDANNAHAISRRTAGFDRAKLDKLALKWSLAFPDVLYSRSQPTLAGGAIFAGGDDGTIYALDPASGCAHWTFHATGPVRMGLVVDPWTAGDTKADPLVYFGDTLGTAYAVHAKTGKLAWKRRLDSHPNATLTGAPALYGGVLYFPISSLEEPAAGAPAHECCTFRGSLLALEASTGKDSWRAWMVGEPTLQGTNANGVKQFGPSGVAIWSTPLVDPARGLVYVVTGDNYSEPATELSDSIIALDLKSGAIKWAHQATGGDIWNVSCGYAAAGNCPAKAGPDYDFGAAPILARGKDGKDYILAGQKSGILYALDPDTGKLRWEQQVGRGGVFGGIHFGIAADSGRVYVPVSDLADGEEYDRPARPGVFALDVATGKEIWAAPAAADACGSKPFCHPGYGAAISVTPDFVFAGSMDGHLRVFDAASGKLLREIDTDIPFATVNGTTGHGGSLAGGPAPLATDGMLIVNSGYGGLGKMPGNVLLVYGTQ